jgi:hypothetical protein
MSMNEIALYYVIIDSLFILSGLCCLWWERHQAVERNRRRPHEHE